MQSWSRGEVPLVGDGAYAHGVLDGLVARLVVEPRGLLSQQVHEHVLHARAVVLQLALLRLPVSRLHPLRVYRSASLSVSVYLTLCCILSLWVDRSLAYSLVRCCNYFYMPDWPSTKAFIPLDSALPPPASSPAPPESAAAPPFAARTSSVNAVASIRLKRRGREGGRGKEGG